MTASYKIPTYVLVDDSAYTSNLSFYWKFVNKALEALATHRICYSVLRVNHNYRNFTEQVNGLRRAKIIANMSPRGDAPLTNKLKDLFYSLSDKGICQVIVVSPSNVVDESVTKLLNQHLPSDVNLNWVAVDPSWNGRRMEKISRTQVIQIHSELHSNISYESIVQMLLSTKTNTTISCPQCCCIC